MEAQDPFPTFVSNIGDRFVILFGMKSTKNGQPRNEPPEEPSLITIDDNWDVVREAVEAFADGAEAQQFPADMTDVADQLYFARKQLKHYEIGKAPLEILAEVQLRSCWAMGRGLVVHRIPHRKPGPKTKSVQTSDGFSWSTFQETIDRRFENILRKIGTLTPKEFEKWIEKQKKSHPSKKNKGLTINALLSHAQEINDAKFLVTRTKEDRKRVETIKKKYKGNPASPLAGFDAWCSLHKGSFAKWTPEPLDSIISDPPYRDKDGSDGKLWIKLCKFADKHLKPNRPMILMLGSLTVAKILPIIEANGFRLWWTCITVYDSETKIQTMMKGGWNRTVLTFYKPILVFVRKKEMLKESINRDVFRAGPKIENKQHRDQQDVQTFEQLINNFSRTGQLICDPCMGSGTTGVACLTVEHRRRFCGADSNQAGPGTFAKAKVRLEKAYIGET